MSPEKIALKGSRLGSSPGRGVQTLFRSRSSDHASEQPDLCSDITFTPSTGDDYASEDPYGFSMQIEHVRDTAKMVVYEVDGVTVQTTHGSMLESVLHQLKQSSRPAFTSMDVEGGDPDQVSGALRSLVKKGALTRSPGILSLRGQERFYLYYSIRFAGSPGRRLVEAYLCKNLPADLS